MRCFRGSFNPFVTPPDMQLEYGSSGLFRMNCVLRTLCRSQLTRARFQTTDAVFRIPDSELFCILLCLRRGNKEENITPRFREDRHKMHMSSISSQVRFQCKGVEVQSMSE